MYVLCLNRHLSVFQYYGKQLLHFKYLSLLSRELTLKGKNLLL